jgi:hypothetical protein
MAQPSAPVLSEPPATPPVLSLRQLAPWAFFVVLLAMLLLYFVGSEQGATAVTSGSDVHEFLHDARHLLAFPCH